MSEQRSVPFSIQAMNGPRVVLGLSIDKHPARKSWILFLDTPGQSEVLAYFRTEERARKAAWALSVISGGSQCLTLVG